VVLKAVKAACVRFEGDDPPTLAAAIGPVDVRPDAADLVAVPAPREPCALDERSDDESGDDEQ